MPRPASTPASGHSPSVAAAGAAASVTSAPRARPSGYLSRPARGSGTSPSPGPPARSSSRQRTVSAASDLLVPITPVGPRLSQPATYSPGSGAPSSPRTRPWALGTTEARGSNGTPGSGTLWYPTERSTIGPSSGSTSPVPPNVPSWPTAVISGVNASYRPVPRI